MKSFEDRMGDVDRLVGLARDAGTSEDSKNYTEAAQRVFGIAREAELFEFQRRELKRQASGLALPGGPS